ncbi:MAG: SusD/RagB family nutrient-binding outer membrane lipoprotein [Sphingobacterium composti]
MKRKFLTIILGGMSLLGTISSCQKDKFDEYYYNPEASVQGDIPRLFSGLLFNQDKASSNTIMPRYWNLYVFQLPTLGTYSQLFGYTSSTGRYEQKTAYSQNRWQYFYTANIASYVDINNLYNALESQSDKDGYNLFIQTSKIFLYDQASQMIDMWGDIPFSEAGSAIATGGSINNAKYDDQQALYLQFIDDLKAIADYLNSYQTNAFYKQMFDKADILNQGNLEKWKIYANSLRLRLAMRISFSNESKAREVVTEIVNNPTKYPVVTEINNSIKIDAKSPELRSVVGVDGIRNSFESSGFNYAPGFIINKLMSPANDPRLPVLFSKNAQGNYLGLDPNLDQTTQENQINNNLISRVDSATFSRNDKFPGIIITPAEVSFLKAEANERWGVGASAQSEYEKGIRQSIDFWYYINSLNDNADGTSYTPKVKPNTATINTFLTHPTVAYSGTKEQKLEKIASQNWANFTVIQAQHAWAEYRRTGFPKLEFQNDGSSQQSPTPPTRLLYPENERTYNTINYEAVRDKDKPNTKIFWDVN